MTSLHGKTALLTGAGREPVRRVALALAARRVRLALSDLTPMQLDETAAQVHAAGGACSTHISDPCKGLAARMLFEEALDAWETVDILVLYPHAMPRTRLLELDEWDFQHTFETNVNGPFLMLQTAGNWMVNEGRTGSIINLMARDPAYAALAAYGASQAALNAFTRSAALEFAEYNIRVLGVSFNEGDEPGTVADVVVGLCDEVASVAAGSVVEVGK